VTFHPIRRSSETIRFSAATLYRMARSKAICSAASSQDGNAIRRSSRAKPGGRDAEFPGGLLDFLNSEIGDTGRSRSARSRDARGTATAKGVVEWAVVWTPQIDPFVHSYCNTIPTSQGGTHEQGLRTP